MIFAFKYVREKSGAILLAVIFSRINFLRGEHFLAIAFISRRKGNNKRRLDAAARRGKKWDGEYAMY